MELKTETIAGKELEFSQQQFNIDSTDIQHPLNVGLIENPQTPDEEINSEPQEFIQHSTQDRGERGDVEQGQLDDVLQNEQQIDLLTTQQDTSSQQTKSLDSTSGQKAFQEKYQPVEVLNSEGKWIEGYFVHKCLVVANLAGIERKYALYDRSGSLYAFRGEIRLPRVD